MWSWLYDRVQVKVVSELFAREDSPLQFLKFWLKNRNQVNAQDPSNVASGCQCSR